MLEDSDDRHNQLLMKLSKCTSDYVTDFRWKAGVGGLKLVVGWMGNPLWWTIFLNKRTSDTFIYTAHTTSPFWAIITPEYYGLILSAAGIAGSVNSDCIWKSRNVSMCNIKFSIASNFEWSEQYKKKAYSVDSSYYFCKRTVICYIASVIVCVHALAPSLSYTSPAVIITQQFCLQHHLMGTKLFPQPLWSIELNPEL